MSKQVPSTSYTLGHPAIVGPSPATDKKKAPTKQVVAKTSPVVSTDGAAAQSQYPYEPYRKASSTSGAEVSRLADPKDLEMLDATAKELYKSDLEAFAYIEALRRRTTAITERVNRDSSALYSGRRAMERIEFYTRNWQRMDDHWTEEELSGDWHLRAELEGRRMTTPDPFDFSDEEGDAQSPDTCPVVVRGRSPTDQEHHLNNPGCPGSPLGVLKGSEPQPTGEDEGDLEYFDDDEVVPNFPTALVPRNPTGVASQPHANPPRPRHPLAQSYVPSSPGTVYHPEPQCGVAPQPAPRSPSPASTVAGVKRKRITTPEDDEVDRDVRKVLSPPTTTVQPYGSDSDQAKDEDGGVLAKRPRLFTQQLDWNAQLFMEAGYMPASSHVETPTRENTPEPSSQFNMNASLPSIPSVSQLQNEESEDSDLEKSEVIELLSREVEQGESSEEEGSTENILAGLEEFLHPLPALTPVATPDEARVPVELPEVFGEGVNGDVVMHDSGPQAVAKAPKLKVHFNVGREAEKKHRKTFRKSPAPKAFLRATKVEPEPVVEVKAESEDEAKPLPSVRKKRAVGPQARKRRAASSIAPEPVVNPWQALPSISASGHPSEPGRGESKAGQPQVSPPRRNPPRKATRSRR